MMKHRVKVLEWDMEGGWDGVVRYIKGHFYRYIDRNGEHKDRIDEVR
jgi:hypothetical protein